MTLVVVTLVVVTLVVVTLVIAQRVTTDIQLVEVDLRASRVDDVGLLQDCRKRLATSDLGHHRRDLATFVDRLGEVVGIHAILLGRHHEVLNQLRLANADLLLLCNRIQQELRTHGRPSVLGDLSAVLVILQATLALKVLSDLGLDERLRNRNLGFLKQVLKDLVPRLNTLFHLLGTLGLCLDVGPELLEGVKLRSELGKVVVHFR